MKKKNIKHIMTSLILTFSVIVGTTACASQNVSSHSSDLVKPAKSQNLMEGVTAKKVDALTKLDEENQDVANFAVRLFKASEQDGQNTLISPVSVLCALAMTANGAQGETLAQMESVLGMPTDKLNLYVYSYMKKLPQNEDYKLSIANSIWFKDDERFKVNTDFLQTNADYYSAELYKSVFDNTTVGEINDWVNKNTDGMIPMILNEIPPQAVMYLVNALAFDAQWEKIYSTSDISEREFTCENGEKQLAEFMYSTEGSYLEDENATGFIKYYKDRKYAFAALLPKEVIGISQYVASLDGKALHSLLSSPEAEAVNAAIPKFTTEYSGELSEILAKMGMTDAFSSEAADLSALGSYDGANLCINRVIHKTFISVDEKGTKAGAVTAIEVNSKAEEIIQPKTVYLDRPLAYMLIDCENNIPIFIGTLTSLNK